MSIRIYLLISGISFGKFVRFPDKYDDKVYQASKLQKVWDEKIKATILNSVGKLYQKS